MSNVSTKIKALRSAKAMTQEQLAQKLHVTRQAVSSWENGKTQPDIDTLARLAAALEVSVEEIIYGSPPKRTVYLLPTRNGGNSMVDNIGRTIKTFASVMAVIGFVISLIAGFISGIMGLLIITPLGCLFSWGVSILVYGFGQLIENSDKCVEILSAVHTEPAAAPENKVPVKTPVKQEPWTCYSCGTVNEGRVAYCIKCNTTKAWSEEKQANAAP